MAFSQRHTDTPDSSERAGIPHIPPVEATSPDDIARAGHPLKQILTVLGPGLITGASDDDPSGIGTYSVTGAQ